jgi:hypothetical protein
LRWEFRSHSQLEQYTRADRLVRTGRLCLRSRLPTATSAAILFAWTGAINSTCLGWTWSTCSTCPARAC